MKIRRVRVGGVYVYRPVMLDLYDGRTSLKAGDVVKVIDVYGAPKANTMGHCYVGNRDTGEFIGMVCCNSLVPLYKEVRIR